jgi:hypothetical protein
MTYATRFALGFCLLVGAATAMVSAEAPPANEVLSPASVNATPVPQSAGHIQIALVTPVYPCRLFRWKRVCVRHTDSQNPRLCTGWVWRRTCALL